MGYHRIFAISFVILLTNTLVIPRPTCGINDLVISPAEQSCLLGHLVEIITHLVRNQKAPVKLKCFQKKTGCCKNPENPLNGFPYGAEFDDLPIPNQCSCSKEIVEVKVLEPNHEEPINVSIEPNNAQKYDVTQNPLVAEVRDMNSENEKLIVSSSPDKPILVLETEEVYSDTPVTSSPKKISVTEEIVEEFVEEPTTASPDEEQDEITLIKQTQDDGISEEYNGLKTISEVPFSTTETYESFKIKTLDPIVQTETIKTEEMLRPVRIETVETCLPGDSTNCIKETTKTYEPVTVESREISTETIPLRFIEATTETILSSLTGSKKESSDIDELNSFEISIEGGSGEVLGEVEDRAEIFEPNSSYNSGETSTLSYEILGDPEQVHQSGEGPITEEELLDFLEHIDDSVELPVSADQILEDQLPVKAHWSDEDDFDLSEDASEIFDGLEEIEFSTENPLPNKEFVENLGKLQSSEVQERIDHSGEIPEKALSTVEVFENLDWYDQSGDGHLKDNDSILKPLDFSENSGEEPLSITKEIIINEELPTTIGPSDQSGDDLLSLDQLLIVKEPELPTIIEPFENSGESSGFSSKEGDHKISIDKEITIVTEEPQFDEVPQTSSGTLVDKIYIEQDVTEPNRSNQEDLKFSDEVNLSIGEELSTSIKPFRQSGESSGEELEEKISIEVTRVTEPDKNDDEDLQFSGEPFVEKISSEEDLSTIIEPFEYSGEEPLFYNPERASKIFVEDEEITVTEPANDSQLVQQPTEFEDQISIEQEVITETVPSEEDVESSGEAKISFGEVFPHVIETFDNSGEDPLSSSQLLEDQISIEGEVVTVTEPSDYFGRDPQFSGEDLQDKVAIDEELPIIIEAFDQSVEDPESSGQELEDNLSIERKIVTVTEPSSYFETEPQFTDEDFQETIVVGQELPTIIEPFEYSGEDPESSGQELEEKISVEQEVVTVTKPSGYSEEDSQFSSEEFQDKLAIDQELPTIIETFDHSGEDPESSDQELEDKMSIERDVLTVTEPYFEADPQFIGEEIQGKFIVDQELPTIIEPFDYSGDDPQSSRQEQEDKISIEQEVVTVTDPYNFSEEDPQFSGEEFQDKVAVTEEVQTIIEPFDQFVEDPESSGQVLEDNLSIEQEVVTVTEPHIAVDQQLPTIVETFEYSGEDPQTSDQELEDKISIEQELITVTEPSVYSDEDPQFSGDELQFDQQSPTFIEPFDNSGDNPQTFGQDLDEKIFIEKEVTTVTEPSDSGEYPESSGEHLQDEIIIEKEITTITEPEDNLESLSIDSFDHSGDNLLSTGSVIKDDISNDDFNYFGESSTSGSGIFELPDSSGVDSLSNDDRLFIEDEISGGSEMGAPEADEMTRKNKNSLENEFLSISETKDFTEPSILVSQDRDGPTYINDQPSEIVTSNPETAEVIREIFGTSEPVTQIVKEVTVPFSDQQNPSIVSEQSIPRDELLEDKQVVEDVSKIFEIDKEIIPSMKDEISPTKYYSNPSEEIYVTSPSTESSTGSIVDSLLTDTDESPESLEKAIESDILQEKPTLSTLPPYYSSATVGSFEIPEGSPLIKDIIIKKTEVTDSPESCDSKEIAKKCPMPQALFIPVIKFDGLPCLTAEEVRDFVFNIIRNPTASRRQTKK